MSWELFSEWTDLQFVNYTISEELEDSTIAAWRMEDWEIYGPGAGGYSSSGPYGNWQDDILAWLNNGSMLARDIIDWDASQLQSHNLSGYTQESARSSSTTFYLNGTSFLPQDSTPTFGPEGSGAEYLPGDIVVTGARRHADLSISYQFASYDPTTHQPVSWVENATFLDMARANADANVIRFDLAEGEMPLSEPELQSIQTIRTGVNDLLASLQQLPPDGYFEVEGWGRIRVSELISLLLRADYEVRPATAFTTEDTIGNVVRNEGNPEVRINRAWLPNLGVLPNVLNFFIIHEIVHATRVGWRHTGDANAELRTSDVAAAILSQLGRPLMSSYTPNGTTVQYRPNLPST